MRFFDLGITRKDGFSAGLKAAHGRGDRVRIAAGRVRYASRRDHPAARSQRADFLPPKEQYTGLGVAELRRLRTLEEENRKLKQLVADLGLCKSMLQDVLSKKL